MSHQANEYILKEEIREGILTYIHLLEHLSKKESGKKSKGKS